MEIRARQAAKSTRLNNIRSNGKYGLDTSRNFTQRQINNIRNGFKRRGNGFFSDETGEPGLLGSDRMVSGDVSVPQSRGVHRTTGDTQTGTRGTVEETLNPKATEVKAPSDFDNIYEGVKEISKQGEKVATDLRWITPEQAANRLKQQSKEGNGVYFKQGTNELTSGMDIS